MPSQSNKKRIAKNTVALYIRMLLGLVVSLYTSRVVLATLGVEDFGVYGVVGGVVGMFSFLNAAQRGATSRFITFELGKGEKGRLDETFVSTRIVHIGIALLVVLLVETVGVWFLNNKLVIPEGRMYAAHWVLQLSILTTFLGIVQTPYGALIIAHEKMGIYAYVELLHVFLKLGIVYLLVIGHFDKLILYAILQAAVSVIILLIYRIYCLRHFPTTRAKFVWKKDILKSLLSFSGYNLFGNMGGVVNLQGTNFVVNIFFGVVYNAAVGIASTVAGAVEGFASNVMTAFRPQITKDYAREDYASFESYLGLAIKTILAVYCIVAIPAYIEIDKVLSIWLKEVPTCSAIFCRFMLVNIFFATLRYIITIGIHATAKVKAISLITGLLQIMNPFVIWLLFSQGMEVEYSYLTIIFVNAILCGIDFYLLHRYVPQVNISKLVWSAILILFACTSSLIVSSVAIHFLDQTIYRILLTVFVSALCTLSLTWLLCLNRSQRQTIIGYVRRIFKKKAITNE